MKEQCVNRMTKALDLKWRIIGVKFLYFQHDYETLDVPPLDKKITVCAMAKRAFDGHVFKTKPENFGCLFGAYAVGVKHPDALDRFGQSVSKCRLYEDYAITKQIMDGMCYLQHQVYGLQMGPLEKMEEADVVLMMASAYQMMRIMQGYAYKHGNPGHLCSVGNQAVCSDLIAKSFYYNDISISFMCKGARMFTQCSEGEMAAAVPINLFESLCEGVVQTVNPVLEPKQKKALLERLDTPDELGVEIDPNWTYSSKLREFLAYADEHK